MVSLGVHQETLERVYDAAFDDIAMERLAHVIGQSMAAEDAAVSLRQGFDLAALSITAKPSDTKAYTSHYWRLDPWTPAIRDLAPGRFAFGEELVPQDVLERSEFFVDYARPMGVLAPMCGRMLLDGDAWLTVSICRTESMTGFSEDDRRAVTELAHHTRRAIQLRRRLQAAHERAGMARAALDAVGFGLALVDADGRVQVANSALEDMARSGVGIRVTGGRLSSLRAADVGPLATIILRAARDRIGGACRLEGADGATHVSAMVVPASPANPFGMFSGRHALVALSAQAPAEPPPAELLAMLFSLTAAEAGVARSLWAGATPGEIASERGVKLTTLKTQFDAIYRKTGAANQQGLLRLFGSLPRVR